MKKELILIALAILFTSQAAFTQVNYTANDQITPYEGYFHPGINLGYYGPNWDDNNLADLSAGNETVGIPGVGVKALRGSLPEGLGQTFTYDIWINKYNYNKAVGTTDNLLFLETASEAHRDPIDYCPSDPEQTTMFANLYEPIWDNGENGTPVNDENYYALYVFEVVSRLKDEVKFWEIWNEPGFDYAGKGFLPPGQPGNWWDNNPDPCDYKLRAPIFNYIRTLRISYEVIKSIAPDDYVCIAGLGYDSFLDAILRNTDNPDDGKVTAEYPLGGGAYFDVVGFHAYPHIDGSLRYYDNDIQDFVYSRHSDEAADALAIRTDARQEVLERYGYDGVTYPKKEWIATEVNVPSTPFGNQPWGSDEVQRNYVMKVNMKAMELDYTQLHLFLLADFKTEAEANFEFDLMGMYESLHDKVPYEQVTKESGIGLKTMSDALYGTRFDAARTAAMNLGDNVGGGAYLHEDGTYTYALWAKTQADMSEDAFATYNFPASFGLMAMIRKEWDHSLTGTRLGEGPGNIQLTSAPIFLRKLEEDQDIFLDVTCDMDIEIRVTATTPEGGQFVTWEEPTAVTNCTGGVTIEQTQGIANGEFFPFGVSEIQYTITNQCGDVKYCAFKVAVASTGGGIGDCNLFRWEMGFIGQFEGNKYFVSTVQKDFAQAQAQCAGHGGYLVSIDSPRENEFLRQQVNNLAMIGYNDVAQEGSLEWTSGKDVVFTNVADCQGCSNSEAGDVAMFNHFNGEWYFIPSSSVEFFIMELPCAEVPPCICTTEYEPVCAPDGTEYSNSCFAECDGIFDYGFCVTTCDFTELTWLEELIETGCDNLDLEIYSFEFSGGTYIIVDDGSSVSVDGGYVVYDCEQNIICTEAGFGSPLCTDSFGADFTNNALLFYSAAEQCAEPCLLEDQVWYQELLADTTLCENSCLSSIESFEFGDSSYVAIIGHNGTCPDSVTEIFNCQQTLICQEGGLAGLTECSTLFGENFPVDSEVIWSAEDCPMPCALEDMVWVDEKIESITCDDCIESILSFEFKDSTFVIEFPDEDACDDVPIVVYDCNGDIFCTEGGDSGSTVCSEYFGMDFDPEVDTLWDSSVECFECDLDEQEWLSQILDTISCLSCIENLFSFEFGDSVYVAAVQEDLDCGGYEATIFNCEGNIICIEGGANSSDQCTEIFGEDFDPDTDILWSNGEECEDCELDDQVWLQEKIEGLDCNSCITSIRILEIDGIEHIIQFSESAYTPNIDCFEEPTLVVFDCEGNIICQNIDDLTYECDDILQPATLEFGEYLYNKEDEECPECILDNQAWLDSLLVSQSLCEECISSIEIYSYGDYEYIVTFGDDEECADTITTGYRCDGTVLCYNGGITDFTECNFLLSAGTQEEVLWEKEVECLDNSVYKLSVTGLDLFPNPADQNVQLSFTADQNMNLEYSIVNIAGQTILSGKYTASDGLNQINFDIDGLVSGMYFVRLLDVDTGGEQSLKLVKN